MERLKSLDNAINFIVESIDNKTNGSRAFYSRFFFPLNGWSKPYPETTGYIIKTFDDLIYENNYFHLEDFSKNMADWILSIQNNDGSFPGGLYDENEPSDKSIFNTAQILIGLHSRYKRTNDKKYLNSATKGANWIAECIDEFGNISKYNYENNFMPSYYSRVCWPILLVCNEESQENKILIEKTHSVMNNIADRQLSNLFISDSGFKKGSYAFLHTIAYTIRGFLECSNFVKGDKFFNIAYELSEKFMKKFEIKKVLAGAYYEDFSGVNNYRCLTGEAQMAIIWLMISDLTGDLRFLNTASKLLDKLELEVKSRNTIFFKKGGLQGSKPFYGRYISFRQPNWASKFYIDAVILEDKIKIKL